MKGLSPEDSGTAVDVLSGADELEGSGVELDALEDAGLLVWLEDEEDEGAGVGFGAGVVPCGVEEGAGAAGAL